MRAAVSAPVCHVWSADGPPEVVVLLSCLQGMEPHPLGREVQPAGWAGFGMVVSAAVRSKTQNESFNSGIS